MSEGDGDEESGSTYRVSRNETVSEGVVSAVSALTGHAPVPGRRFDAETEALEPLHTVVDPDALDTLFGPGGTDERPTKGSVVFRYNGVEVTVRTGGTISAERFGP